MNTNRIIYSSEYGAMCPRCQKPLTQCSCQDKQILGDGHIKVRRETKGRKGKTVVVIQGLPLSLSALKELAQNLKRKFACGGSVKNGTIEIQTDQIDQILTFLHSKGYKPKRSGG